jgi:hypothetical protein
LGIEQTLSDSKSDGSPTNSSILKLACGTAINEINLTIAASQPFFNSLSR